MEVLGKEHLNDEIFDVKIVAGYAFINGMHGIYAVDLTKEEINIEKIIDFGGNDLPGRLLLSGQLLVTTFNRNDANYLYDMKSQSLCELSDYAGGGGSGIQRSGSRRFIRN